jgi:cysteine desulfurase/selenocysteine lyase
VTTTLAGPGFDVATVRADFPVLSRTVHDGVPLVYLDSAATSQKPRQVLDALADYYERHNANVHRGVHTLAEEATALYEGARDLVARFVNAPDRDSVIFTRNATDAINLVAGVLPFAPEPWRIGAGDEIVVTEAEHHSNLLPWQLLAQRTGARLRWIRLTPEGLLDETDIDSVINPATKMVAFTATSNVLGTVTDVPRLVARAHSHGALALVDASQTVPHRRVDVGGWGADFVAFTGHKMLGPTGIGVLVARPGLLAELPPWQGGGEMVDEVTMEMSTYALPPHRFEAGTPPIAQAVGLGAAVEYLSGLGMDAVAAHERLISQALLDTLAELPGIRVLGPTTMSSGAVADRGGAVSFIVEGVHSHDVGQVCDSLGVAVRVGHHCARPALRALGVDSCARASTGVYTDLADVAALGTALRATQRFFGV